MPTSSSSINNFTKGLLTEFTGLNFPENAATDCDNVEFTLVGDVCRRLGINYEVNGSKILIPLGAAINTFKWDNAGGDGESQIVALQVGVNINFYLASNATLTSPLSDQFIIGNSVTASDFTAAGGTFDPTQECQFASGNGYLFVYHPSCDPFYCTFVAGAVTGNRINLQVRDFTGTTDGLAVATRPQALSAAHEYNLFNQGWVEGNPWQGTSFTTNQINVAVQSYTLTASGLPVQAGDSVSLVYEGPTIFVASEQAFLRAGQTVASGTVVSYVGTVLDINMTSVTYTGAIGSSWIIIPLTSGNIDTWFGVTGNFPSNADVWWYYKDDTGVFNPSTTLSNVTVSSGNAPSGHFVYNPFFQNRAQISGLAVTNIQTAARPTNGAWYSGRVWFTGVNASQAASNDAPFTTWTESVYFSQVVQNVSDLGNCYQVNDPTSSELFDLLPTDGGVIVVQGSGNIYKLFPIQNGMLVFAANGIWFITGSQGIGFAANDYTITKISSVRCISGTSFVDVNGLPYFWNEEGIYAVEPQQGGGLAVNPLTVGSILTFYSAIPTQSKLYARAAYDPINYVVQWMYRTSLETSISTRYSFDSLLNFNTYNKAFFPYTVSNVSSAMNGIVYVASPGGIDAPDPVIKYLASTPIGISNGVSFAEEYDTAYVDWGGVDYTSSFITGYRLAGKSLLKFQPVYIYVYSNNSVPTQYLFNGLWDYASNGNGGRESSQQLVINTLQNAGVQIRRHKVRGRGMSLQLQVQSVPGQPFDIIGWSSLEQINAGI